MTIPSCVTNIGDWAFGGCYSLTNVVFEGGMDGISMNVIYAFEGTPWLDAYLASLPIPDNDNFAGAELISGESGQTTGTNLGASVEDGEPLVDFRDSEATVWWAWTAPKSATFAFNTYGSDFDTVMGVYTGNALNGLSEIVVDDDGVYDNTSAVTFDADEGTTYYIAVGGYESAMGTIVLSWNIASTEGEVIVELGENVVTDNGDGTYTITAPLGGELTADDVDDVEVKVYMDGEWVQATGTELYLGVVKQTGASGFYKVSVCE